MRFHEYVEQREAMNEADMPPPSPPAIIRAADYNLNTSGKNLFRQVMSDNLQKFNGDMKKAIEYSANWQPSEKDSPGFVKALKDAADANDIFVHIPSWLKKYE